jgi:prepilin-type N-terminal cleavage/methylation domain-containing protein
MRIVGSGNAEGFTLVEVLVSMTLLSVASLTLGTLLLRSAKLAGATSASSYQTAALSAEAARMSALPFDSLPAGTTCVNLTGPLPGTRCTTVSTVSAKVKQVLIVLTPSNALMHPDTTTLRRTQATATKALKTS